MDAITEANKAAILTHDLRKPEVRAMLSGFLRAGLCANYPIDVPAPVLREMLDRYVRDIDRFIDQAVDIVNEGIAQDGHETHT